MNKNQASHLFVGDLHTKYRILEKVIELGKNYDKVVFLGDYVDDWNAAPEASYNILKGVIDYKLEDPKKVELCIGNHEGSECFGGPFRCSGYNGQTHSLVAPLFSQYECLFNIAYVPPENNFICSHAGFTNSWIEDTFNHKFLSPKRLAELTNRAFHNRNNFESPHQDTYERIFYNLANAGYARGGHGSPSPTWADTTELISDWWPHLQIVGHTPHPTVTFYNNYDREIYFCDTHSTYADGTNIGDDSLLVLENGELKKIDLNGKEIPW